MLLGRKKRTKTNQDHSTLSCLNVLIWGGWGVAKIRLDLSSCVGSGAGVVSGSGWKPTGSIQSVRWTRPHTTWFRFCGLSEAGSSNPTVKAWCGQDPLDGAKGQHPFVQLGWRRASVPRSELPILPIQHVQWLWWYVLLWRYSSLLFQNIFVP